MKVDNRLAIEMLKTITERMRQRAEGRKRLTAAEARRKERAKKKSRLEGVKRPIHSVVFDEDYGEKPLQYAKGVFYRNGKIIDCKFIEASTPEKKPPSTKRIKSRALENLT